VFANQDEALKQLLGGGQYRRVTLGKGVGGKSTSAFLAVCGVLSVIGASLIFAAKPIYPLLLGVLVVGMYVYYQWSLLAFAKDNPAAAVLEGGDFLKWHQRELAAKSIDVIPNGPSVADPQNPIQEG
jgi:hypothetical protein